MSEKGNSPERKWHEAVRICGRILSDRAAFDDEETNYKLEISNRVKALFDALEKGEDFVPLLKRAFSSPNNLTSFYAHAPFIEWAAEYQGEGERPFRWRLPRGRGKPPAARVPGRQDAGGRGDRPLGTD